MPPNQSELLLACRITAAAAACSERKTEDDYVRAR